jgi:glutaryl-CoA dehydrogenase
LPVTAWPGLGIVFGALGPGYDCLRTALDHAGSREAFGRSVTGFQPTHDSSGIA